MAIKVIAQLREVKLAQKNRPSCVFSCVFSQFLSLQDTIWCSCSMMILPRTCIWVRPIKQPYQPRDQHRSRLQVLTPKSHRILEEFFLNCARIPLELWHFSKISLEPALYSFWAFFT